MAIWSLAEAWMGNVGLPPKDWKMDTGLALDRDLRSSYVNFERDMDVDDGMLMMINIGVHRLCNILMFDTAVDKHRQKCEAQQRALHRILCVNICKINALEHSYLKSPLKAHEMGMEIHMRCTKARHMIVPLVIEHIHKHPTASASHMAQGPDTTQAKIRVFLFLYVLGTSKENGVPPSPPGARRS